MSPPRARSILLMASLAACSRPGRIEAGREADAAAADAPAPVPDVLPRDLGPPDFPPDGAEIAPAPFACKLPPTTTGGRCNLCGDGRIEECSGLLYGAAAVAQASDPPRPPPPNEFCDGAPQPGATCASLGFLGGELRCADSCVNHDTSGCTICGSDPALRGCRASVVPEGNRPIGALALAATETQIALAWSVFDAGGADYGVGIRRFHPDLSPIDETSCVRFKLTGGLNLALVPTPAGFLLASEQYTSARLTPLGPDGALRGPGRELTQAWAPRLASRPEGGQAVAWFDRVRKDVAFVGVIDVEGREVAPPIQFPADVMAGEL
ncbi:MAG TPA: hypothetical protein VN914_16490, partial [Polyangia bacterium]|nr:hypothetical protein [Polyangia bacterium]